MSRHSNRWSRAVSTASRSTCSAGPPAATSSSTGSSFPPATSPQGLFSGKRGAPGLHAKVIGDLTGRPVDAGSLLPGSAHDTRAFRESGLAKTYEEHLTGNGPSLISECGYIGVVPLTPDKKPEYRDLTPTELLFNRQEMGDLRPAPLRPRLGHSHRQSPPGAQRLRALSRLKQAQCVRRRRSGSCAYSCRNAGFSPPSSAPSRVAVPWDNRGLARLRFPSRSSRVRNSCSPRTRRKLHMRVRYAEAASRSLPAGRDGDELCRFNRARAGMEVLTSGGVWGDVPSWISSGATLFALLFAAVAAVAARRTYRIESERDRTNRALRLEQEAYGRRSQASLISVWWGVDAAPGTWGAFVRNASGAPVFQVSCTVLRPDDGEELAKAFHAVVPPSLVALFEDFGSEVTLANSSFNIAFCRVRISFTDAAGIRWERNEYGRLTELRSIVTMKSDLHRARALELFASNFQNAYGVEVAFEVDPDRHPQKQFMADVTAPEAADALICPHDWIGALNERDHLEPLTLSPMHSDAFESWALDAFQHDGHLFGIPISTDTVTLFRNTAFVPDVPATFEQLIATGQKLCDDGTVQEVLAAGIGADGDPFQTWPMFTSLWDASLVDPGRLTTW